LASFKHVEFVTHTSRALDQYEQGIEAAIGSRQGEYAFCTLWHDGCLEMIDATLVSIIIPCPSKSGNIAVKPFWKVDQQSLTPMVVLMVGYSPFVVEYVVH
jgi:hypothetical protein